MYYWPEESGNAPYATDLAEHLVSQGHEVTVLCGMPHYPQWRIQDAYSGRFRMEEERTGVRIVRRWHFVPGRQSAVRRAAYEASFLMTASPFRQRPRPDAVVGIAPSVTSGVLARVMATRANAAYGVIIQDLVGAAALQTGIPGGSKVAALARRAERWMTAEAAFVAPVTRAFYPYLVNLGVPGARIEVLPNWSRLGRPSAERWETRRALGWRDDEMIALHAGNMGLKQGLEQIVEAARLAERDGAPIRFVLMGDGNQRGRLESLGEGLARFEVRPFVDVADLPDVLSAADVLIVAQRASVHEMSMPSKLTAYFAAGRPVVAAVDPLGSTADEIARAGAGRVVPAEQPRALIDALLYLHEQPALAATSAASAKRYAETALSRGAILARASELVARLIERSIAMRRSGGA